MVLSESKADQVINCYINFCNEFKRTGQIIDKNFNRIRVINSCIGGKQEDIRSIWGDLFDEVYKLLENPAIKSRLDNEKKEIEKLRIQKLSEKNNNQKLQNSVISSSKIKTKTRPSQFKSSNIKKRKKGIITKINGEYIEQKSIAKINSSDLNVDNTLNPDNTLKQKTKKRSKNNGSYIEEKSIQELRKIFWSSVAQAKQNEQAIKIINKDRKIIKPVNKFPPICRFDDSSIFEAIMDEKRAEGKGYGGSK
ncbi:hypothetical protein [Nodularia sp. UHCC 0506]|uniref:hypothetical protein n=1 Tax=Nodularia sp. UHCC 0506 TaxID=3110243 RepID=UPI002B2152EF|nr:hypothetical protein [Nodularia sp. UHCC 0506]MEA5514950.1 hypothetical protein [Nodularia sp. UHCC 0506]